MPALEATLDIYEWWKDRYEGKLVGGQKRSPDWREVRKNHIKEFPNCYCCGGTENLQVHHIIPFSIASELELESHNLLTLCSSKKYGVHCHLLIGHCGNYREWNPFAPLEGKLWNLRLQHRDDFSNALVNAIDALDKLDFESSALYKKIKQYEHYRLCW